MLREMQQEELLKKAAKFRKSEANLSTEKTVKNSENNIQS
jgi:ribosomal protein L29